VTDNNTVAAEDEESIMTGLNNQRNGSSPMSRRVPLGQVLDIIEESNKEGGSQLIDKEEFSFP
jgi:hypothetical protein